MSGIGRKHFRRILRLSSTSNGLQKSMTSTRTCSSTLDFDLHTGMIVVVLGLSPTSTTLNTVPGSSWAVSGSSRP